MGKTLVAVVAVALALTVLFFAALGSVFPTFIVGLAQLPGQWWDRIGFVPERRQLERELKDQAKVNEQVLADLKKARDALLGAQVQAGILRKQATEAQWRIEGMGQAMQALVRQTNALQAQVDKDAVRIAELDAAAKAVASKPVPHVTTRQEAIDTLRRLGYPGVR